jgi:RNA polymerase sigma factor (sigma-70 family)
VINALILDHISLVHKLVYLKSKKLPRWVDIEEVKSSAYLGLVEAAHHFQSSLSSFSTYAFIRINGAINDYLRSLKRVPLSLNEAVIYDRKKSNISWLIEDLKPIEKNVVLLYYEYGYNLKEIGVKIGVKESRVSQLLSKAHYELRKQHVVLVQPTIL